jgi:hypothetical protein
VEVWECGLAHPRVLAAAGLPGRGGLAAGMGLDRLLMLVKHIPDIRLLRSGDPRITCQMLDLARYQYVSSMPPRYPGPGSQADRERDCRSGRPTRQHQWLPRSMVRILTTPCGSPRGPSVDDGLN